MTPEAIPFHRPYYGRDARARLDAALAGESLYGGGHTTAALERRLGELLGVEHVLLTPSCTSALELAARVAGFGPGDEVLVPAFTFVSSASAVSATGARPVFVDVSPDNLCIDLARAERAVTGRTRGIVPVHYAGQACDLDRLLAFADRHRLTVVEDAAQALLCRQGGRMLGTAGQFGCFSFHDSKVFTAGEGGALAVNDARFLKTAVQVREKGTNRHAFLAGEVDKYGWVCQGTSAFMGGLPAALLDAQLDEREEVIARREAIFDRYDGALRPLAESRGWRVIRRGPAERLTSHIYWMVCRDAAERRAFADALRRDGIAAAAHYPSLHLSAHARAMGWAPAEPLPVTEHTAEAMLRLPLFTAMTDAQVERVVAAVREFLQAND